MIAVNQVLFVVLCVFAAAGIVDGVFFLVMMRKIRKLKQIQKMQKGE